MFEICEVEKFARNMRELCGGVIETVAYAPWIGERKKARLEALVGWTFTDIRRHGKALIFCFENPGIGSKYLVSRLGMSGVWANTTPNQNHACSFSVTWSTGGVKTLCLKDKKRTATLEVVDSLVGCDSLAAYGPDPLSDQFTLDWVRLCARHMIPVKALMMRPEYFAGVGNWVANETLFRANLNPMLIAAGLTDNQTERLLVALLKTITAGVSSTRAELSQVYGRSGKPCYICGTEITKIKIGGRGTFFCAKCQAADWVEAAPISADFVAKIAEEVNL